VAAVVVLLAAAVLLQFTTPCHFPSTPSELTAMAPAIEAEPRKPHRPVAVDALPLGDGTAHHEPMADTAARLPRALAPAVQPSPVVDTMTPDETVPSRPASGAAHPRTARDAWNPGAAAAPTPSTLQTFRC
jgi:hypothetical protein